MSSSTYSTKKTDRKLRQTENRRWRRAAVLAFAAVVLILSCGIPREVSIPYPAINIDTVSTVGGIFSFSHDTRNGQTLFLGYMFFYRFYSIEEYDDILSTPEYADFNIYLETRESIDFTPAEMNEILSIDDTYTGDNRYRILYVENPGYTENLDEDAYLRDLEIPEEMVDTPLDFELDFSGVDSTQPAELSYNDQVLTLSRRQQADPSGLGDFSFLSFSLQDFVEGQGDLPSEIYESEETSLVLTIYVVPYGFDFEGFTGFYFGEARTLGYYEIPFRLPD